MSDDLQTDRGDNAISAQALKEPERELVIL